MLKLFFAIIIVSSSLLFSFQPVHANLDCSGYNDSGICTSDGESVASFKFLETIFTRILNIAIGLISLAILVMIVIGAYRILTSGGDPKGVQAGRDIIMWAIIGLVVAVSSYFIISLIGNITGTDVTTFEIDTTAPTTNP